MKNCWPIILMLLIAYLLTGCATPSSNQSTEGTILGSNLSEKGKTWLMVLSETNKLFGLLILIGVIGGAVAFYFKDSKLLGIPLFCAAGCFFLKFLITAGDILAYVCVVIAVLVLVLYAVRKHKTSIHSIIYGQGLKRKFPPGKGVEDYNKTVVQPTGVKKEIRKIKDSKKYKKIKDSLSEKS